MRNPWGLAILLVAGLCAEASACSCARLSAQQVIDRSETVFRGTVLASEAVANPQGGIGLMRSRVSVSEVSKGSAPKAVIVESVNPNTPMCGYPLVVGRSYRFGGTIDATGRMHITMCGMVPLNGRQAR